MTAAIYHHEQVLGALWAVPALAVLCVYAWRMRRRALRRFADPAAVRHVIRGRPQALRAWQALGGCAALAMVILSLARPAWNVALRAIQRQGRDVVFVLDVSRSMLADDVPPSRLERAKLAIGQCVDQFEGDRVALVAFAGSAGVRCPLTLDYAFFRMALEDVDPGSVARGGTRIGDALDTAIAQMPPGRQAGYRDIILITDGEDHGSSPADAAARLDAAGVRLIAIGIGDEVRGRRIPVVDPNGGGTSFVTDGGGEVRTHLEAGTLREMVRRTSAGAYLNVGTGAIDIVGVYRRLVAVAESTQLGEQAVLRHEEKFQIFLGAALLVWFGATVSVPRDHRRRPSGIFDLRRRMRSKAARAAAVLVILIPASTVRADALRTHMASGRQAYAAGDYGAAVEAFAKARQVEPQSSAAARNLGSALYRRGLYIDAGGAFETAASLAEAPAQRAACIHNAANCLFRRAQAVRQGDRASALRLYRAAARYYRLALDGAATRRDTAHNLEVARRTAKALADQIKADEDKKRELLAEIRKRLDDLIRRQIAAAATGRALSARKSETPQETESLGREMDRLAADQKGITADTRKVADLMSAAAAVLPSMPAGPDSPPGRMVSPMDQPRRHVRAAMVVQGLAEGELARRAAAAAHPHQDTAAAELKLALETMPDDGGKDAGEDGEGEKKPGDKDGEGEHKDPRKDDGKKPADEDTRFRPRRPEDDEDEEFTAPKDSVDDILAEEKLNNVRRAKKRPATYKPGDKDW